LNASSIVMVDDEPTTLDILAMYLKAEGYQNLVKVGDATRALETIRQKRADLVLLDIAMPGLSGLEILRIMREDSDLRSVPVVIFTSATDAETKREALELGADEFLAKPFDPSELSLRVRNTLTSSRGRKQEGKREEPGQLPCELQAVAERIVQTDGENE
jgi:DNA-binding response OmpR family regulator